MSCPQCAGALQVTAESERTVTCQYCQSAVYLPDPLWQRLHPVRIAAWWYVKLQGLSAEDERAELDRKWKEDLVRAQPYGTRIKPPAADRDYSWVMAALFLVCGAVGATVAVYYYLD
jgi:hypothetical protein